MVNLWVNFNYKDMFWFCQWFFSSLLYHCCSLIWMIRPGWPLRAPSGELISFICESLSVFIVFYITIRIFFHFSSSFSKPWVKSFQVNSLVSFTLWKGGFVWELFSYTQRKGFRSSGNFFFTPLDKSSTGNSSSYL